MKIVLHFLLITYAICEFPYRKQIVLPTNVKEVEFSPEQKYLAVASDDYLQIYNGVTGGVIKHIPIPDETDFTAFSFSQDSSMMAVGYSNGDIKILREDMQF